MLLRRSTLFDKLRMTFRAGNFYPAFPSGNTDFLFTAGTFVDMVFFPLVYSIFTFSKNIEKPILIG
jgi:hypothetical protein